MGSKFQINNTNLNIVHTEPREGDTDYSEVDTPKARERLDYGQIVSLWERFERTIEW